MHHSYNLQPANNLLRLFGWVLITLGTLLSGCVTGKATDPLPYLREQGDFFMQAGIDNYRKYNFKLAIEQFNQARKFYSRFDDYLGTTHAWLNLAQVHISSGEYDAAREPLSKANILIRQHNLQQPAIYHDMLLTGLYLATDQFDEAEKIFNSHQQILQNQITDEATLALLVNRTRLAQVTDRDFIFWLELLAQQATQDGHVEFITRVQRFRAWQAILDHNTQLGNQLFATAVEFYRQQANPIGLMSTQLEWAQVSRKINDWNLAVTHYEQTLYLAMANRHSYSGLRALEGLRSVYQQTHALDKLPQIIEWEKQLRSIPGDAMAP